MESKPHDAYSRDNEQWFWISAYDSSFQGRKLWVLEHEDEDVAFIPRFVEFCWEGV